MACRRRRLLARIGYWFVRLIPPSVMRSESFTFRRHRRYLRKMPLTKSMIVARCGTQTRSGMGPFFPSQFKKLRRDWTYLRRRNLGAASSNR